MTARPFTFKTSPLEVARSFWDKVQSACSRVFGVDVCHSVQLNPARAQSATWARVMSNGTLQLELFDYSDQAHDSLGNDVAWIWTVAARHRSKVTKLLEERTGAPIADDAAMLDAMARSFRNIYAVREWLAANHIPVEEEFEPWA